MSDLNTMLEDPTKFSGMRDAGCKMGNGDKIFNGERRDKYTSVGAGFADFDRRDVDSF